MVCLWIISFEQCREFSSNYPSLDDLEEAHFACKASGDLALWSPNAWMTWGEGKPEADPNHSAVVAAYQVTFVHGDLVFSMHSHHYASDVMGWHNFTRQLAENSYAVYNGTAFPPWDPACIDVSRFTTDIPAIDQVDSPSVASQASRHPDQQAPPLSLASEQGEPFERIGLPYRQIPADLNIRRYVRFCVAAALQDTGALLQPCPVHAAFFRRGR